MKSLVQCAFQLFHKIKAVQVPQIGLVLLLVLSLVLFLSIQRYVSFNFELQMFSLLYDI